MMFNRSGLFLVALFVAVGGPYMMSDKQATTRKKIARIWDAIVSDGNDRSYPHPAAPVSSASPMPSSRSALHHRRLNEPSWKYPQNEPVAQFTTSAGPSRTLPSAPQRGYTAGGIIPAAPASPSTSAAFPPPNNTSSTMNVPQTGPTTTALPIPYTPPASATAYPSEPDADGWVTIGPAPAHTGAPIPGPTVLPGTIPGIPANAQILPGIVVGGPGNPRTAPAQPSRPAQPDIRQLLNFEHAPDWVIHSWPRVSTHIIDGDLSGMRVALVSGTNPQDLAGSLSYYFDRSQKLQRISFEGATGDPTRLIQLATKEHGMQPEPSLGGGMFVTRSSPVVESDPSSQRNAGITSVLRLRRAPIVRASRPLQKYLVMLELNQPASDRGISRELGRLLQLDRRSQRWIPDADANANGKQQRSTDPSDPFSPASPNDSPLPPPIDLPQQKEFAEVPVRSPQPTASPTPDTAELDSARNGANGAIPRGNDFQNQSARQKPLQPGSMVPALRNRQPPRPMRGTIPSPVVNPLRGQPPRT